MNRTKNASRNIIFGIFQKLYLIIGSFITRTIMIYCIGVEYLGLNNLFASVIQVLSITEMGIGTAMTVSMYKPIAENDDDTVCALLKLYKIYYRVIGGIIAVIGILIMPFIPRLIAGSVPSDINIYVLYMLNLSSTVISYWLFAYKRSLLEAHQRNDVISKITMITTTISLAIQFIVLFVFRNYYGYVITLFFIQALTNIMTAITATKMYPRFQSKGDIAKDKRDEINKKIKALFTAKLGYVVNESVDTIVISAFLGLVPLAIYNNYYYIMNSVQGFIFIVFNSITAGIGNSLVIESKEKNFDDLKKLTFIIFFLTLVCSCCFLNMYQPFMEVWVGTDLMLPYSYVIMIMLLFFVKTVKRIWVVYKDAAGIWREDQYRPLICAGVNLCLNIILVKHIGLAGILISTIVSEICISFPWILKNLFTYVLKVESKSYLLKLLFYTMEGCFCCLITVWLCNQVSVNSILQLFINGVISVVVSLSFFSIFNFKSIEFKESYSLIKRMCKR